MNKTAVRFFAVATAVVMVVCVSAQEYSPVRAELSRVSRTSFTNWEMIELTYAVGYLDGYEVIKNDIMPQAMNFGALELDPEFADKLDIRNTRKFGKENFFDVVYHLRYLAEKKGDVIVPGQRFAYRELKPGSTSAEYFPTPEFKLTYRTVLTDDASDIKDGIDLGSYQKPAAAWKISAVAVFTVGVLSGLFLIFFRPVVVPLSPSAIRAKELAAGGQIVDPDILVRNLEADIAKLLVSLSSQSVADPAAIKRELGSVCNGLKDVIRYYVPAIGPGTFSAQMAAGILALPSFWERQRLLAAHSGLVYMENILFRFSEADSPSWEMLKPRVERLAPIAKDLRPARVYWHRLPSKILGATKNPFRGVKFPKLRRRHGKT